jgi:large repetitive protein
VPRGLFTGTLMPNGQVLVAGGLAAPGGIDLTASAELYDPVAGTWTPTGNLLAPLDSQTATLLPNGVILVAGGVTGSGLTESPTASAELFF